MQLFQREYGEGEMAVVVLHGLLGSAHNWHTVARNLSQRYRLIVPSLRNHGESPHAPHTTDAMVSDIHELLDRNRLDKAVLLGHSMGGMVAMRFAMLYPERLAGLVVVDVSPVAFVHRLLPVLQALTEVDLGQVKSKADADAQLAAQVAAVPVRQFLLQNLRRGPDGIYSWQCNLAELHNYVGTERFTLQEGQVYTENCLFIAGGRSELRIDQQADLIREHFPKADLKIIKEAGHWIHFEAREEFTAMVADYLAGLANHELNRV